MSMTLVEMENVGVKYLDYKYNLTINKNDFIVVSGINGSGKSTLIKLVAKIIKPDFGIIKSNIKKINYIHEKQSLPMYLNVLEYIKIISRLKKCNINYKLIQKFKLPINKKIYELSKGNQQKLSIIIGLMGRPDIIIFDEPLSGLDEKNTIVFIEELKKIEGTYLIATHKKDVFNILTNKEIIL